MQRAEDQTACGHQAVKHLKILLHQIQVQKTGGWRRSLAAEETQARVRLHGRRGWGGGCRSGRREGRRTSRPGLSAHSAPLRATGSPRAPDVFKVMWSDATRRRPWDSPRGGCRLWGTVCRWRGDKRPAPPVGPGRNERSAVKGSPSQGLGSQHRLPLLPALRLARRQRALCCASRPLRPSPPPPPPGLPLSWGQEWASLSPAELSSWAHESSPPALADLRPVLRVRLGSARCDPEAWAVSAAPWRVPRGR